MQRAASRIWFVTGCSSGLGRALCERLLESGARAVCTARNVESIADLRQRHGKRAIILPLDVTDPGSVQSAVQDALAEAGAIDVLVNNAGYGLVGALEEVEEDAVRAVFDANVYGTYRVTRAVLPHMRERRSGHILNVSSMAGFVAGPGFCFYSATKFAVEGMTEALAGEVAGFGVRVTLIEPGPFRTDFRSRSMQSAPAMKAYAETVGKFRKALSDTDGKQPGDPRLAAEAMMAVVEAEQPPLRLPLGEVCLTAMRGKLDRVREDLDRWEAVALATSYVSSGH
ncbi:MAG: SDR family NAD(P)-dependent oxidoreductase [Hyphomicrobiaceae bacterium]|nr:SDR family NAD(P)-dependent oxidoreductase [Hyphomicrobiaceae bacterium]